jgi:MFS family permease
MNRKVLQITLLCLAELMGMAVWFSATAAAPAMAAAWRLDSAGAAWLTMSVQLGFVAGAFLAALLNLADRCPAPRLFALAGGLAAAATAAIAFFTPSLGWMLGLRFLTGLCLAGVYPVGMKLAASWTQADRGLGLGLLVGALTLGSASPYLLSAWIGADWRVLLLTAALATGAGALIAGAWLREGPHAAPPAAFDWRYVGKILRDRPIRLANLGYLGHMWELYAMWTWIGAFLAAGLGPRGVPAGWVAAAAFGAIAAGGAGCVAGGVLADRWGRTSLTAAAMGLSGACCLAVGLLFRSDPLLLGLVCGVWGFSVVADSAQFSACVTELCAPAYMGTALTFQTCLGFLLTLASIRLIPILAEAVGWRWAFAGLAAGPVAGIWAMLALRRLPDAARLAGGRR